MAREVIISTDAGVSLNDPVAGKTRITLSSLIYTVGSGELILTINGLLAIPGTDYTEEDSSHVVIERLLETTAGFEDVLEFITVVQGSSNFIPPPSTLTQLSPPKRPNNFGGRFIFT